MAKPSLYLVNGALGAGKTTVVDFLLRQPFLRKARVIENEFASVSVDTQTLAARAKEVATIAGACICCHDGDELVRLLEEFAQQSDRPVIIESTGVANTVRLIEKLAASDVLERYELAQSLYVLDALETEPALVSPPMRTELQVADLVIVSKGDAITTEQRRAVTAMLAASGVDSVVWADHGMFGVNALYRPSQVLAAVLMIDAAPLAETDINYTVLQVADMALSPQQVREAWRVLQVSHGLRRLKGGFTDGTQRYHVEATPRQCMVTPSDDEPCQLVCIGTAAHMIHRATLEETLV